MTCKITHMLWQQIRLGLSLLSHGLVLIVLWTHPSSLVLVYLWFHSCGLIFSSPYRSIPSHLRIIRLHGLTLMVSWSLLWSCGLTLAILCLTLALLQSCSCGHTLISWSRSSGVAVSPLWYHSCDLMVSTLCILEGKELDPFCMTGNESLLA